MSEGGVGKGDWSKDGERGSTRYKVVVPVTNTESVPFEDQWGPVNLNDEGASLVSRRLEGRVPPRKTNKVGNRRHRSPGRDGDTSHRWCRRSI